MSEGTTTTPAPEPTPTPAAPAQPAPVPYARFAEVNQRATDLAARVQALEAENKAKAELETRLQAAQTEALRLRVAAKAGLPLELAARLQGDTEDALLADATQLGSLVKPAAPPPPATPGVPPAGAGAAPAVLNISNMTPAQIRENAANLLAQSRANLNR